MGFRVLGEGPSRIEPFSKIIIFSYSTRDFLRGIKLTESHHRGLPEPPVGVTNMLLHERQDTTHNVVANRVGHEGQASSSCHSNSPLLIIDLFFLLNKKRRRSFILFFFSPLVGQKRRKRYLLGEKEGQNWHCVRKGNFGEVAAHSLWFLASSFSLK